MSFAGKRPADWTPAPLQTIDWLRGDDAWVVLQFARPLTEDELHIVHRTLLHHLPATLTGVSPPQEG